MPILANPRHEAFAAARANGLRVFDSYIAAGFEGNPTAASQIETRPEVRARVQELIQEKQEKRRQVESASGAGESISDLDRAWVLRELKINVRKAQESGQVSAANKAIELLMDILDITPKKRVAADEDEAVKDVKKSNAPNDERLHSVLDKLNQMGGFDE